MKTTMICCCVWLFASSRVFGQITIISDERSVSAYAQWQYDVFLPDPPRLGTEVERDERSMTAEPLMPFDARVTAVINGAAYRTATAWQQSNVTASEIFAAGGTEDASVYGVRFYPGGAGALSTAMLQFSLAAPTQVRVEYEVVDIGIVRGTNLPCPLVCQYSGGAGVTINGPGFEIVAFPDDGIIEPMPDDPIIFNQVLAFAPGEYSLSAIASVTPFGDEEGAVPTDVSFMVRLTVIPEPSSLFLTLGVLAFPLWKVAKRKRLV